MSVTKRGSQWVVTNKAGTKVLGKHPTKREALKQLKAIEANKSR